MSSAVKPPKTRAVKLALASASIALSGYLVFTGWQLLDGPKQPASSAPDAKRAPRAAAPGSTRLDTSELARSMLARNIFDSASGPIAWSDPPPTESSPPAGSSSAGSTAPPSGTIVDCPGDVRLLAAVVFDREPERSFGVIRTGTTTRQLRVGSPLESGTLVALAPTQAHLRDNSSGAVCRVPLFPAKVAPAPAAPAPPPPPAKEPPAKTKKERKQLFSGAELDSGVTALGGDRYRIRRELLTKAMADAAGVVRGSKFFPQKGGERNAGVKIQGVADGSVLHRLGIRSGDILRTLNGVDLSSTDGMLGAYALLREQSSITLSITRGGSAKNLQYEFE